MLRLLIGFGALLSLAACSHSPAAPEPVRTFPAPGTVRLDTLTAEPVVFPFDGRAGQEAAIRASAEAELYLCLASAEAWARINAEGLVEAPPETDLAGDALACHSSVAGEVEVLEVLPRDGAYVVVAEGSGPVRFEESASGRPVVPLTPGVPTPADLGQPGPWSLQEPRAAGVHFVRGRDGERLTVTVEGDAFSPYVEVGAWYGAGYTPLVGNEAEGDTARVEVRLPADGLYTVRVVAGGGEEGGYTVRADLSPEEDWALRFPGGGAPDDRYALIA